MAQTTVHSAADAALGFMYQVLYALLALWRESDDDAKVLVEFLDDIMLVSKGETLLEQIKHNWSGKPKPLTVKSVPFWKTLKVWIDVLPHIEISKTRFILVSVADISSGSILEVLLDEKSDRKDLEQALRNEAQRVQQERVEAKASGTSPLPHAARAAACKAFLELGHNKRTRMIEKISLKPRQSNILCIEKELAHDLTVTAEHRDRVAQRLVEWWNRQVLYSMCDEREKAISRFEVVQRYMQTIAEIEQDKLTSPYATSNPPASYQPDSMINKQIALVGGTERELNRAIREEWRARATRSKWSTENPNRNELIRYYDERLTEEWSDRHSKMRESFDGEGEDTLKAEGRNLLNWSHCGAPKDLEPIAPSVVAPYYVRGSYQVLSTTGQVGWHPNFRLLLGFDK